MFFRFINTYWNLRLKYQESNRINLSKNLAVQLQAISLANRAICEIESKKNQGRINSKIARLLKSGVKKSLRAGEITYRLKLSNNISITVRDSSIQNRDIKVYSFSESNLKLNIQLSRNYYTSIALGFVVFGCVVMFLPTNTFFYPQRQTSNYSNKSSSSSTDFPMNFCGDRTSGGANFWYPVYVAYNQLDLAKIKKKFCCDAVYSISADAIQVASFYDKSRASNFVKTLDRKGFSSARVGFGSLTDMTKPSVSKQKCFNNS